MDTKNPDISKITEPNNNFHGYTIEELRYQRALVALQKEFCKNKIFKNVNNLKKADLFAPVSGAGKFGAKSSSLVSKLLSGLNYLDYAMLGFSAFKSGRKIFRLFKK